MEFGTMGGDWELETVQLDTVDWEGNPLHLDDVPGERHVRTGRVRLDPQAVARSAMRKFAQNLGVGERELPLLLMLYGRAGHFRPGVTYHKYGLNKMLFYQWKRLGEIGLGEAYGHDEFPAARAGPVPLHLREDLQRLEGAGILRIEWSTGPGTSTKVELTSAGADLAARAWNRSPESFKETTLRAKEEILPMSPSSLKEKVHRDFPDLQRVYREEDRE